MARILDNHAGRRMISLSPDDVLTVVSLYQQHLYQLQQMSYDEVYQKLGEFQFYLPEEP